MEKYSAIAFLSSGTCDFFLSFIEPDLHSDDESLHTRGCGKFKDSNSEPRFTPITAHQDVAVIWSWELFLIWLSTQSCRAFGTLCVDVPQLDLLSPEFVGLLAGSPRFLSTAKSYLRPSLPQVYC